MPLIDSTYFIGEITLPTKTYSDLDTYIARYEKEFLVRMFGYGLYKLIAAYDSGTSPQRIKDIVEGKEFTLDGYTHKWNGLINSDKISPIAYYVYYYYQRNQVTATVSDGEVKSEHENAILVEANQKFGMAWLRFLELIGEIRTTEWTYFNSLMFFMFENYENYPEWTFEYFGSVNQFDL